MTIEAFTDGACKSNPGPGGWGVVLRMGPHEKELSGSEPATTNNRMEITAAIRALQALKRPSCITIHTDSRYLINGITKWICDWEKNGWKTAAKKPVLNTDLWQELQQTTTPHTIKWAWIKGHDGHPENERADQLASAAAEQMKTP
jgi:ribonuclease HI